MENKKIHWVFALLVLILAAPVLADSEYVDIGDYSLDISYDSDDLESGNTFSIDVKVTNDGDLKEDVILSLVARGPFDEVGDDSENIGTMGPGESEVVKFRIDIDEDVEEDDYKLEFEIEDSVDEDSGRVYFYVKSVRPEVIIGNVETLPGVISPSVQNAKVVLQVENKGDEHAENLEVTLNLPEGITPTYSNNNRFWIGRLNSGESKSVEFYINADDNLKSDLYDFEYIVEYEDSDDNFFDDKFTIPFLVRSSPNIEILSSTGSASVGSDAKLYVRLVNLGEEAAEAVDVRIIKENTQPFDFDVRSDYIGEMLPGEEAIAIFDVGVLNGADIRSYNLKLLIRAKGDSDSGNDLVYTFNRRATFSVTEKEMDKFMIWGLGGLFAIMLLFSVYYVVRK